MTVGNISKRPGLRGEAGEASVAFLVEGSVEPGSLRGRAVVETASSIALDLYELLRRLDADIAAGIACPSDYARRFSELWRAFRLTAEPILNTEERARLQNLEPSLSSFAH